MPFNMAYFLHYFVYGGWLIVDEIIKIIENEDKKNPLTDEKNCFYIKYK